MKTKVCGSLLIAMLFAGLSSPSAAEGIAVSGEVGSTGVGAHFSVPVAQTLNVRLGVNYLRYNINGGTSDVDYKFKLKLNTFDALADWHPMENGFRLTGGMLWNGNKIDATAKPQSNNQYQINGQTYDATSAGSVKGKIDFGSLAPYLGIGWGNAPKRGGWSFSSDLGVIFQGSPSVSLKNRDCMAGTVICGQLARDLEVERAKLEDEIKNYRYYPVLRLGVGYRF